MTTPNPIDEIVKALEAGRVALNWFASVYDRADCRADAKILEEAIPLARSLSTELKELREAKEWHPIETVPEAEVVLLCDARGNRWTDVGKGHPSNSCGYPPIYWRKLPPAP